MSKKIRIVIAQLNFCVGDISGNLKKSILAAQSAREEFNADLIVFPELNITGYPPEDLLFHQDFVSAATEAVNEFKEQVRNIYCIIGHPQITSKGLYNSCSLIYNGVILSRYAKQNLPNYGIFDEHRYFTPGNSPCITLINGIPISIIICEDLWHTTPVQQAATLGARLVIIPNASPFEINKHEQRHQLLAKRAKSNNIPLVYVNCVGQQDEILFDGGSMAVNSNGDICQFVGFYHETLYPVDIEVSQAEVKVNTSIFTTPNEEKRIYDGLVFGVRDYLHKNHFSGAIVGVSGGIDSALTLAIAVDALGKDNVTAYLLPSRYTADISMEDALNLAKNLGIHYDIISIEPMLKAFLENLSPVLQHNNQDVTEQNIQARCRGIILMALSNQTGKILLTTGNRSEMATGYATLYGDMAGGLAVLKDVPKMLVYRLTQYRNSIHADIPERIITRPPTAELAPNQKDEDSLPPYPLLDKILELYLNQEQGYEEIIAQGFDPVIVKKVINLVNKNEYKRRQSAIGIRINHKAFGRDRRYPITSKY